jgi:hypothetical protein
METLKISTHCFMGNILEMTFMSKQLKDGGLQYVSRILTNKYNVSFSTLILIDATRNGNLMTVIAALYGIESSSGQSYQFLSDTVKHANKKATLPIFQITNMTRHDLIEMGIEPISGRRPRWLSLTKYGTTILKEYDKLMYE